MERSRACGLLDLARSKYILLLKDTLDKSIFLLLRSDPLQFGSNAASRESTTSTEPGGRTLEPVRGPATARESIAESSAESETTQTVTRDLRSKYPTR